MISSDRIEKITKASIDLLKKNRRQADGFCYTAPALESYPHQWLWDSCFHAIVLSHFDISIAKAEMKSLVAEQFDNGMIPHMIYWEGVKETFVHIDWGKDKTSSITQPPMLAYAVWQIFNQDKDAEFLESMYRPLYHFYRYLLSERDPRQNHLVGLINPDESGEDNSPRFDKLLDLPPRHSLAENTRRRFELFDKNKDCKFDAPFCMKNFFWVKDVPFNAIMVRNLELLALIAETLGNNEDALIWREEKDLIVKAMAERMKEDGLYWSTYGPDYKKIKVMTWAIFSVLFGGLPDKDEADKLVEEHLLNPAEFFTTYPISSTSQSEPAYDPEGFWRGPTWISINWFVVQGLCDYGFYDLAEELTDKSLALIEGSGFREYFSSKTGQGLGARDFTWGTLVIDMIERLRE